MWIVFFVLLLVVWRRRLVCCPVNERTCEICNPPRPPRRTAAGHPSDGGDPEKFPSLEGYAKRGVGPDLPTDLVCTTPGSFRRPLSVSLLVLCSLLFLAPSFLWTVRNYRACGHFPVLSTLRGQALYGGSNQVTANDFKYWGYWVFPDAIPGEKTLYELSRTMSEYDVEEYYYARGKDFIRQHPSSMPWLFLGRLVRAYVPVPWKWGVGTAAVALFRWALYVLAFWGLWRYWRGAHPVYRVCLLAMVATNLAQVLGFWGCARFAFAIEPFLVPFAGAVVRAGKRRGLGKTDHA